MFGFFRRSKKNAAPTLEALPEAPITQSVTDPGATAGPVPAGMPATGFMAPHPDRAVFVTDHARLAARRQMAVDFQQALTTGEAPTKKAEKPAMSRKGPMMAEQTHMTLMTAKGPGETPQARKAKRGIFAL
ncbi:hypothetical protein RMQ97_10700 [Maricaulis sp. D1M11]|uniref:hypothetical protein n=1 Tax=Maricaulis sp. D1M11 TaxID=3076117 RepID=UPI0039B69C53